MMKGTFRELTVYRKAIPTLLPNYSKNLPNYSKNLPNYSKNLPQIT